MFRWVANCMCMSGEANKLRGQSTESFASEVSNKIKINPTGHNDKMMAADMTYVNQIPLQKEMKEKAVDALFGCDKKQRYDIKGQSVADERAEINREAIGKEWKLLSKLIDRVLFWASLITVVVYFIVMGVELKNAQNDM